LRADQTSPSLKFQKAEQAMKLTDAISKLPEAQQQVIILHHLHGQSLADVAIQIDRSQSAVAGLLYRGLKTLRSIMSVKQ
jgi:RNA polymerase sigma-70 factor (ECF subfamily)